MADVLSFSTGLWNNLAVCWVLTTMLRVVFLLSWECALPCLGVLLLHWCLSFKATTIQHQAGLTYRRCSDSFTGSDLTHWLSLYDSSSAGFYCNFKNYLKHFTHKTEQATTTRCYLLHLVIRKLLKWAEISVFNIQPSVLVLLFGGGVGCTQWGITEVHLHIKCNPIQQAWKKILMMMLGCACDAPFLLTAFKRILFYGHSGSYIIL